MHLHHHGRAIHTPGKISDLPLPHIVHLVQAATTSAALKPPVNRLAPHPQFQRLRPFVQFVPLHPVPRPREYRSLFFVRQLLSVPKKAISQNHRYLKVFPNSCGEPFSFLRATCSAISSAQNLVLGLDIWIVFSRYLQIGDPLLLGRVVGPGLSTERQTPRSRRNSFLPAV